MRHIKPAKNLFSGLQWKTLLKDVVKFYLYAVFFYGLSLCFIWSHFLYDTIVLEKETGKFNLENYRWLGRQLNFYIPAIICFGVFFTTPPRTFKHVAILTLIIFVINNITFWDGLFVEYLYDFFLLAGFVIIPWVFALAWQEYKEKKSA